MKGDNSNTKIENVEISNILYFYNTSNILILLLLYHLHNVTIT